MSQKDLRWMFGALVLLPWGLWAGESWAEQPDPGIGTRKACEARTAVGGERRRCLACVDNGGAYRQLPGGAGICGARPAAIHQQASPGKAARARTPAACRADLKDKRLRKACVTCVRKGGAYQHRGIAGICLEGQVPAPGPPAAAPPAATSPAVSSLADCKKVPAGKRRRQCKACVKAGGVYNSKGPGVCRGWSPAGTRPQQPARRPRKQRLLRTVVECRALLGNQAKRKSCEACVASSRRYYRPGKGRCLKPGEPEPASPAARPRHSPREWLQPGAPDRAPAVK